MPRCHWRYGDQPQALAEVKTGHCGRSKPATDIKTGQYLQINSWALRAQLPTIYFDRVYVETGGLMSYGPNWPSLWRRAAEVVDKILRGAKPADIPVEQPRTFELVINLKTARALGLDVPASLLARADEVIE